MRSACALSSWLEYLHRGRTLAADPHIGRHPHSLSQSSGYLVPTCPSVIASHSAFPSITRRSCFCLSRPSITIHHDSSRITINQITINQITINQIKANQSIQEQHPTQQKITNWLKISEFSSTACLANGSQYCTMSCKKRRSQLRKCHCALSRSLRPRSAV
jgi:hypothetical protein